MESTASSPQRARDACGTDVFRPRLPSHRLAGQPRRSRWPASPTWSDAQIWRSSSQPSIGGWGTTSIEHFWDSEHQLYNDRCDPNFLSDWAKYRDPKLAGKFITEPTPGDINKSVGTFLPLFAEIAPPERVPALQRLLQDSKKGFEWPNGIPGYSLDSAPQGPEDDTGVRSAKIWPPVQYLVQQGFKQYQEWGVAQEVAERYFNAVVAAYMKTKMIREALSAAKPEFDGHKDFVGWGGLAPIGNFIEYILGFDVVRPAEDHRLACATHGAARLAASQDRRFLRGPDL